MGDLASHGPMQQSELLRPAAVTSLPGCALLTPLGTVVYQNP